MFFQATKSPFLLRNGLVTTQFRMLKLSLHQFDATIPGPTLLRGIIGQGAGLAEAGGLQAGNGNALADDGSHYFPGPGLRQYLVVGGRTGVVG